MDTTRSQEVLSFQHHTWLDTLAEMRAKSGWKRYPIRLAALVIREFLRRRSPYYRRPAATPTRGGRTGRRSARSRPEGIACGLRFERLSWLSLPSSQSSKSPNSLGGFTD